jgi:TATA-box binding protein (TBP) (component of TFIID and TFIIIB)
MNDIRDRINIISDNLANDLLLLRKTHNISNSNNELYLKKIQINNLSNKMGKEIINALDKYDILTYKKLQELNRKLEPEYKPPDIKVSTITLSMIFNTEFNVENIANYIDLDLSFVLEVICGKINRSLLKKKKEYTVFKNHQVTLLIYYKKSLISLKIFHNGTIHMTGCKSIEMMNGIFSKLFKLLKETKKDYILSLDPNLLNKNNKININNIPKEEIIIKFVSNPSRLEIKYISDFKVNMINCDYNIGFSMNRTLLYNVVQKNKHDCIYDPVNHSAVIITHPNGVSILVFEKGSIVITGGRTYRTILEAYDFINILLLKNYHKISKNDEIIEKILQKYY